MMAPVSKTDERKPWGFDSLLYRQMKLVQYSKDLKSQETIGEWSKEEAKENWPKLQEWIYNLQPYGFFRMINSTKDSQHVLLILKQIVNNKSLGE